MAVDEALVRSIGARPAFRVYGWQPPAVSFGYAQRISREVDAQKVRERGIDIVRRPTGGRAILHWNELTYSVVCPADNPIMGQYQRSLSQNQRRPPGGYPRARRRCDL